MSHKIKHSGVIEQVSKEGVVVRILQTSACAACKIASHCNASEMKEKLIDVACDTEGSTWTVGQQVMVATSGQVVSKALLVGFGLPLLILLATLVAALWLSYDEATAALAAVAMLLPYYLIVWLLRDRIRREVSFQLETN